MVRFGARYLNIPRFGKVCVAVVCDAMIGLAATWFALAAATNTARLPALDDVPFYFATVAISLPIFTLFGLYRAIFRHTGLRALHTIFGAFCVYAGVFLAVGSLTFGDAAPFSAACLQPVLFLVLLGGSRILMRSWFGADRARGSRANFTRVLVYGAGAAGIQLARAIGASHNFELAGFLDDDRALQRSTMNGVNVYAPEDIASLIDYYGVTDVLLAIPSAEPARRLQILDALRQHRMRVRSIPGLTELARGSVELSAIRELDIADLLGRDAVPPVEDLLRRKIQGRIVLVTGAGGSIGSELCRQIVACMPHTLILVDHSEYNLYEINAELSVPCEDSDICLVPMLADVADYARMDRIIRAWRPQTIYHAAAYKHVPLVQHNVSEGLHNNVVGSLATAIAAARSNVEDFVLVSTDKAVRPTNVMGASKRLAELVLQALSAEPAPKIAAFDGIPAGRIFNRTRFSMVRFGNVLGSSGSVVPRFRQQLRDGGPITLTDAEVTRYFMTIAEAAQLVIQAGAMAVGGEVFVLDMGPPIKVMDLARRMVELSGLTVISADVPNGDIEIRIVGLRPGEKLYEELLIGDSPQQTSHPKIMKANEVFIPWNALAPKLVRLAASAAANEIPEVYAVLAGLVDGFTDRGPVVDYLYLTETTNVERTA